MAEGTLIVFSTFGNADEARGAARTLVEERLAACGNLLPAVESIYRWKGAVETATETLVIFKIRAEDYGDFEARLKQLHSYETPEIVALRVEAGSPDYLRWVDECCSR
ncbi:MAG TPA: divalent-cation tolerance protein CutA [Chthoniobacteraceae bacterium]|jgi:periplasmic divalent cation tolerance protein